MAKDIIPLVAISGGILIVLVAIIGGIACKLYTIHRQTNLKQVMLEAGMSPHDIERVMNAGNGQPPAGKDPSKMHYG